MAIDVELQIASEANTLPHPSQFRDWISTALIDKIDNVELTIRVVDTEEMQDLNNQYRKKNKATNVLTFPAQAMLKELNINKDYIKEVNLDDNYLGDIIICAPYMEEEAAKIERDLIAHWAHIVIHGALHLVGYTHEDNESAEEMEGLETELLVKLGFEPPYGDKINYE